MSKAPRGLEERRRGDGKFGSGRIAADAVTAASRAGTLDDDTDGFDDDAGSKSFDEMDAAEYTAALAEHAPAPGVAHREYYSSHTGSNYTPGELVPAKDIAKNARNHAKALKADGLVPDGWELSCTSRSFAGGQAVDFDVWSKDQIFSYQPGQVWNNSDEKMVLDCPLPTRYRGTPGWEGRSVMHLSMDPGERHDVAYADCIDPKIQAFADHMRGYLKSHTQTESDIQTDYYNTNCYTNVTIRQAPGAPEAPKPTLRPID